jgi:hypothetical protein
VAANDRKAAQILVGHLPYLLLVTPGSMVKLVDGFCGGWALYSRDLDPLEAAGNAVFCVAEKTRCPGKAEPAEGRLIRDPICNNEQAPKRCIAQGQVTFVAKTPSEIVIDHPGGERQILSLGSGQTGEPVSIYWGQDPPTKIRIGKEDYSFLVGPGQRWTVTIGEKGSLESTAVEDSAAPRLRL